MGITKIKYPPPHNGRHQESLVFTYLPTHIVMTSIPFQF
jgi:hypothetical protein